jgi:hypothetical protein
MLRIKIRYSLYDPMKNIFTSPSLDDLINLLKAWRFWVLGALFGAVIGAAIYYIAPPQYRARATVNVDFNLEQAWPKDIDRQQFFYLDREVRKIVELAWSDDVMNQLSTEFAIPVQDLRGGKLLLSQPAEAGWHFFADDDDSKIAAALASAWADAFSIKVQAGIDAGNINEFVRLEVTQSENLPLERRISLSGYLLAGSFGFLTLAVFVILFIKPKSEPNVS